MKVNGGVLMGKILMIYASQSGNTEMITDIIADNLSKLGHEVIVKSFEFDVIEMDALIDYDAILVGTYTWDDGEMPYEVEDFYVDLEDTDINGLLFGVYGSADSFYDTFGLAIDLVAVRAKNLGANVIEERLKIDLEPDRKDEKRCASFANVISQMIETEKKASA